VGGRDGLGQFLPRDGRFGRERPEDHVLLPVEEMTSNGFGTRSPIVMVQAVAGVDTPSAGGRSRGKRR